MRKVYFITGIAGTGKSTLTNRLKGHDIIVYDIDTVKGLCHWQHKETKKLSEYFIGIGKDWLNDHEYICDVKKLNSLIQKNKNSNIVIAGIAANQKDFLKLFDKVILLYCDEETLIKRLSTRKEGNEFAKDKSEQELLLEWSKDFQKDMLALGAVPINTNEPISKVLENILAEIKLQDYNSRI